MKRQAAFAAVLAAAVTIFSPAFAFDNFSPDNKAPEELKAIRAKIKAKDFQGALKDLKPLLPKHDQADVHNLLGFSLRKTGDFKLAAVHYERALQLDPNHLSALEYQGEMFVETNQMDKARANLAKLKKLCPKGCEELADLEEDILKAEKASAKTN